MVGRGAIPLPNGRCILGNASRLQRSIHRTDSVRVLAWGRQKRLMTITPHLGCFNNLTESPPSMTESCHCGCRRPDPDSQVLRFRDINRPDPVCRVHARRRRNAGSDRRLPQLLRGCVAITPLHWGLPHLRVPCTERFDPTSTLKPQVCLAGSLRPRPENGPATRLRRGP